MRYTKNRRVVRPEEIEDAEVLDEQAARAKENVKVVPDATNESVAAQTAAPSEEQLTKSEARSWLKLAYASVLSWTDALWNAVVFGAKHATSYNSLKVKIMGAFITSCIYGAAAVWIGTVGWLGLPMYIFAGTIGLSVALTGLHFLGATIYSMSSSLLGTIWDVTKTSWLWLSTKVTGMFAKPVDPQTATKEPASSAA